MFIARYFNKNKRRNNEIDTLDKVLANSKCFYGILRYDYRWIYDKQSFKKYYLTHIYLLWNKIFIYLKFEQNYKGINNFT